MKTNNNTENTEQSQCLENCQQVLKQLIIANVDRSHDLKIEEVKQMNSFENMNDQEINELIAVIKKFSTIAFSTLNKNKSEARIISINDNHNKNKAA